jgi:hypothetical protein
MRYSLDDLTPDQRRHEIAAILAKGILRLHSTQQSASNSDTPEPVTPNKDLDVCGPSSAHGTDG